MATVAGFRVTVLDPREGFATTDRFPRAELVREWPDQAMAALGLDRRTAVVALTHDPKIDDPALSAALESDAFYLGALGSRKTQGRRGGSGWGRWGSRRLTWTGSTGRSVCRSGRARRRRLQWRCWRR